MRSIYHRTSRFLREEGGEDANADQWGEKMAKKYYDNLFREYAVCDLKHYKSGNVRSLWLYSIHARTAHPSCDCVLAD